MSTAESFPAGHGENGDIYLAYMVVSMECLARGSEIYTNWGDRATGNGREVIWEGGWSRLAEAGNEKRERHDSTTHAKGGRGFDT